VLLLFRIAFSSPGRFIDFGILGLFFDALVVDLGGSLSLFDNALIVYRLLALE